MLEDRMLVFRFNRANKEALNRIYEKYKDNLLGLAVALLNDVSLAEDVVHDVFVSFAQSVGTFKLTGSLRSYLSTCVANRARDRNRNIRQLDSNLEITAEINSNTANPEQSAICNEESKQLIELLSRLPYEQSEIIVLHLHHGLNFRQIAKLQNVSINTIQSRYRYGLDKLKSMLDSEVKP